MAKELGLVDGALEAWAAAILTGDVYVEDEANSYLNEEDVWRALEEAGVATVDHEASTIRLTKAGERRLFAVTEQLIARVRKLRTQPDFTGEAALCLELAFRAEELTCTRTLVVPAHITFDDLHTMLQAAMGWQNLRTFDFTLVRDGELYFVSWPDAITGKDPRLQYCENGEDLALWVNGVTAYLDEWLPEGGQIDYTYDDYWEMDLTIVGTATMDSPCPVCLGGEGDTPPEDEGGEWGSLYFPAAIDEGEDDEDQGFERFDVGVTNARLAEWRRYRRLDIHMMPLTAQFAAFGAICFLPAIEWGTPTRVPARCRAVFVSFVASLYDAGLSESTIERHLANAELICRDYLSQLPSDETDDSVGLVDDFFTCWLPRERPGWTKNRVRECATSVKKLVRHMVDIELIDSADWRAVSALTKERLPLWIEVMEHADEEVPAQPEAPARDAGADGTAAGLEPGDVEFDPSLLFNEEFMNAFFASGQHTDIYESYEEALSKTDLPKDAVQASLEIVEDFLGCYLGFKPNEVFADPIGIVDEYFVHYLPPEIGHLSENQVGFWVETILSLFEHMVGMGLVTEGAYRGLSTFADRRLPYWVDTFAKTGVR